MHYISRCCRISSPSLHSSSRTVRSSGEWISSSSLLWLIFVLVELAIVALLMLSVVLLLRFFFLNQLRFVVVLAASVSEATDAAYSRPSTNVGSVLDVVLRLDDSLVSSLGSNSPEVLAGLCLGVGTGVTSVEGVDSTSSASRYHFLRRV